ncbi:MAG: phosphoribosylformylglycinamidine cyclo-ligase [Deltaproteobacteria bacterium]|nr:phosphoribosylformylglycinamidine cyclo-ligase [Deltaproteobacteria bacterium]
MQAAPGASVVQDRYKEAGVDIDAGALLVDRISPLARSTMRDEVLGGLGHFGAMWSIPAGRYNDLVLVSATDGVGTKLKVAQAANRHDTIGIDLVAMCVNDIICTGAEPFFFLDYFASGKLDVDVAEAVVSGIAEGCRQAGCALVGGETAEMPGVYDPGVYDLAGFSVGGAERSAILDGTSVRSGMAVVGLTSSGLHSNGYSLVRRILFDELSLDMNAPLPGTDHTIADELLQPTRIYVRPVLAVLEEVSVAAIAHITGGGLLENIPRVIPEDLAVRVERESWSLPAIYEFLETEGRLSQTDLLRTFNCGVGMVLLVDRDQASTTVSILDKHGQEAFVLGEVVERPEGCSGVLVS